MTSLISAKEILCTLGPASMNDRVIARLEDLGVSLFRINLSHTKMSDLPRLVDYIRGRSSVPICLDTEGAQVRTGDMVNREIAVRENSIVHVHRLRVAGDAFNFNLYPENVYEMIEVGDFVSIDFNSVLVQVIIKDREKASMRVLHGGVIGQNKAVTVEREIPLQTLTEKDRAALEYGRQAGIEHVALSFANRGSDVDLVREISGPDVFLIAKIECRNALLNLDEIARKSDALLIDRGDLSRQEPIERIPALQKAIIARGKAFGRRVYVATNLLESMVTSPKPTRAEVNDVVNTLIDGADGLVLAAETAIGKDPVGCVSMIVKLIQEFNAFQSARALNAGISTSCFPADPASLLIEPHGGQLVHRVVDESQVDDLASLKTLRIRETDLIDCKQIAVGAYSPLTGFMDRQALDSVLAENRLPGGLPWTMPILLQFRRDEIAGLARGQRVALSDEAGTVYAVLDIADIYTYDLARLAQGWFATQASEHPGVALLSERGEWFLAGDVTLVRNIPSPYPEYELTPQQARFVFTHKGWNKVVAFHGRNVIHRVHEHIQLEALEKTHADGLFINPVIGPKKPGDFLPEPIMQSYQMMIDFGIYPSGKVLLGSFSYYPRYCGPREAVFTALCRKNMGCSHIIVGRNHAGVGDFYQDSRYPELFDQLGDLGISPVFFESIGFNTETGRYEALGEEHAIAISGTKVRESLLNRKRLPEWFMRDMIQDRLLSTVESGRSLFHEQAPGRVSCLGHGKQPT